MSTPRQSIPKLSGKQGELHRMILASDTGHKADIQTCSGHLGPRSLTQKQPDKKTYRSHRMMSQYREEALDTQLLQQTGVLASIKRTKDTYLVKSHVQGPKQDEVANSSQQTGGIVEVVALKTSDSSLDHPRTQAQSKSLLWEDEDFACTHSPRITERDQLRALRRLGKHKQDLWDQNCMAGKKAAENHEKKIEKELKKLSVQSRPSRERLAVFSDVFDDVCNGSLVFGGILREIKRDYDLYLNCILGQSTLQNTSLVTAAEALDSNTIKAEDLEEAEKEVSRLQEEIRRALQENKRVRNTFQNVKSAKDREDRESTLSRDLLGQATDISSTESVHSKRLEPWQTLKELQQLEKEIKEDMVSVITTTATERSVRYSKADIIRLIASNDRLKITNKDLENNINRLLTRGNATKALREEVWDCVWSPMPSEGE